LLRGERVVSEAFRQVVLDQSTLQSSSSMYDFLLVSLIVACMVYLMYKWEIAWRDPVRRRAMLVLNGLKRH
jgi:uncharacterized protein YqhQ